MIDSADIYFIQHFADIYFSKSVYISIWGRISSKSYLLPSFIIIKSLPYLSYFELMYISMYSRWR